MVDLESWLICDHEKLRFIKFLEQLGIKFVQNSREVGISRSQNYPSLPYSNQVCHSEGGFQLDYYRLEVVNFDQECNELY